MWVLKLGGSLLASGHLARWVAWLEEQSAHAQPILVVPGGGPFADAVRAIQPAIQASDLTAHRQALLAMQQYGWLLLERLPLARALRDTTTPPRAGVSIWLPAADHVSHLGCPEDWRTSADALALDLAVQLGAHGLACVKSRSPLDGATLEGCFDAVCLDLAGRVALPVGWLGPGEFALASQWLGGLPLPVTHTLGGRTTASRI